MVFPALMVMSVVGLCVVAIAQWNTKNRLKNIEDKLETHFKNGKDKETKAAKGTTERAGSNNSGGN